jgi:hypothetical protein
MDLARHSVFRRNSDLRVRWILNCAHGKTTPCALIFARTTLFSLREHPMWFTLRDRSSWCAEAPDRADVLHRPEARGQIGGG